uniref:Uncharacterized protein n=1 Tax=Brassica campestris TaxID=3711 RepID=M4DYV9_BRACM
MGDDDKEELFVLEKDQCWVVVENKEIKAKEAYDSRYIWSSFNSKHCWKSYELSENSCGSWPANKIGPMRYEGSKKKKKLVVQLRTNQQAIAGLSGAEPLSVHCREREVVAALRTLAYYLDLLVWFTTHKTSRKRYWRKVQAQLRARAAAKKEDKKLLMPHPCTAK